MPIPSEDVLLEFIATAHSPVRTRDIADMFKIKGDDRVHLKRLLRDLVDRGTLERKPGQTYAIAEELPLITTLIVCDIDLDGDALARPQDWDEDTKGPPPRIEILPDGKGHADVMAGDRILAKLKKISTDLYSAEIVRKLDTIKGRLVGEIVTRKNNFVLIPAQRRSRDDYDILPVNLGSARDGDLVVADILPSKGLQRKQVRIVEVLGKRNDPKAISLIAAHEKSLSLTFPKDVLENCHGMTVPALDKREDLRAIPLVTIDGADARDFDDAVFAEADGDGGYHLIVAIADVSSYVQSGTALDREAYKRGNSTYFPDRVLPMLPEALSNDLCSLRPNEDRATLAVHLWINTSGDLLRYRFVRGLMRSVHRLTYEQVQDALNGNDTLNISSILNPLFAAFKILDAARIKRGALDLDIPERKIIIDETGHMRGVKKRERLDSHKLIEEFMILANVAAAKALEAKKIPCVYRIHDKPSFEKLNSARDFLDGLSISLPPGTISGPKILNDILHKAHDHPYKHLVHQTLLRSQAQAVYSTENIGHFGLGLQSYAHFTSPIRRYADLLVHRALVKAYGLGQNGLRDEDQVRLDEMAAHISATERASIEAERNATDRFCAAYLSSKIGVPFFGRISGVTRFGLFVTLNDSGADGLVPIRTMPQDFYVHDEKAHALVGRRTGRIYRLGAQVRVVVTDADAISGSTTFELMGDEGADLEGGKFKPSAQKERFDERSRRPDKHRESRHKGKKGRKFKDFSR